MVPRQDVRALEAEEDGTVNLQAEKAIRAELTEAKRRVGALMTSVEDLKRQLNEAHHRIDNQTSTIDTLVKELHDARKNLREPERIGGS